MSAQGVDEEVGKTKRPSTRVALGLFDVGVSFEDAADELRAARDELQAQLEQSASMEMLGDIENLIEEIDGKLEVFDAVARAQVALAQADPDKILADLNEDHLDKEVIEGRA